MTGRSCNLVLRPTQPRIIRRRNVFIITDKRAIFDRNNEKEGKKSDVTNNTINKYIYPPFNLDITRLAYIDTRSQIRHVFLEIERFSSREPSAAS